MNLDLEPVPAPRVPKCGVNGGYARDINENPAVFVYTTDIESLYFV